MVLTSDRLVKDTYFPRQNVWLKKWKNTTRNCIFKWLDCFYSIFDFTVLRFTFGSLKHDMKTQILSFIQHFGRFNVWMFPKLINWDTYWNAIFIFKVQNLNSLFPKLPKIKCIWNTKGPSYIRNGDDLCKSWHHRFVNNLDGHSNNEENVQS